MSTEPVIFPCRLPCLLSAMIERAVPEGGSGSVQISAGHNPEVPEAEFHKPWTKVLPDRNAIQ